MMVPLGFYLRYYFRFDLKKTILCGFLVSLFFELTQLSGLYGFYPKPYRYTDVDDLITNTLGTVIGYWISPYFTFILPSREEIDRISYFKGKRVTFLRRVFAAGIDGLFLLMLAFLDMYLVTGRKKVLLIFLMILPVYFVLLPMLLNGSTPGQAILRLRTVGTDGSPAKVHQHFIRNLFLYGIEPVIALFSGVFLGFLLFTLLDSGNDWGGFRIFAMALSAFFPTVAFVWVLRSQIRFGCLPHDHYARTVLIDRKGSRVVPAE